MHESYHQILREMRDLSQKTEKSRFVTRICENRDLARQTLKNAICREKTGKIATSYMPRNPFALDACIT